MLQTIQKIKNYTEDKVLRAGFSNGGDYYPTLAFKISNTDTNTSDSFKVENLEEAEKIVIYFISSAKKGEIFTNDIYQEDKDLFLKVKVILPTE